MQQTVLCDVFFVACVMNGMYCQIVDACMFIVVQNWFGLHRGPVFLDRHCRFPPPLDLKTRDTYVHRSSCKHKVHNTQQEQNRQRRFPCTPEPGSLNVLGFNSPERVCVSGAVMVAFAVDCVCPVVALVACDTGVPFNRATSSIRFLI